MPIARATWPAGHAGAETGQRDAGRTLGAVGMRDIRGRGRMGGLGNVSRKQDLVLGYIRVVASLDARPSAIGSSGMMICRIGIFNQQNDSLKEKQGPIVTCVFVRPGRDRGAVHVADRSCPQ